MCLSVVHRKYLLWFIKIYMKKSLLICYCLLDISAIITPATFAYTVGYQAVHLATAILQICGRYSFWISTRNFQTRGVFASFDPMTWNLMDTCPAPRRTKRTLRNFELGHGSRSRSPRVKTYVVDFRSLTSARSTWNYRVWLKSIWRV